MIGFHSKPDFLSYLPCVREPHMALASLLVTNMEKISSSSAGSSLLPESGISSVASPSYFQIDSGEKWKTIAQAVTAGVVIVGAGYLVRHVLIRPKSNKTKRLPAPPLIGPPNGQVDPMSVSTGSDGNHASTVSYLAVYPVKSCGPLIVDSVFCSDMGPEIPTPHGPVRDRSWMVTTDKFNFLSLRRKPKMALIQPVINGAFLELTAPGMEVLRLLLSPDPTTLETITTEVWGQIVAALDCGDEASRWLSLFLELPGLRLVHYPRSFGGRNVAEVQRASTEKVLWDEKDKVAFADLAPYLLVSEESIAELSRRTRAPVPWLNFRPNIVVKGCPPNREDNWGRFRIRDAEFRNGTLCIRCIATTVDPETGVADRKDVLETLRKYRMNQSPEWNDVYKSAPLLAINVGIDKLGTISVGDLVVHLEDR